MTKHAQEIRNESASVPKATPQPTGATGSGRPRLPFFRGLGSRPATTTAAPATNSRSAARTQASAANRRQTTRYFIGIFAYFILGEFLGIAETAIFAKLPSADNPTLAVLPALGKVQLNAVIFALTLILLLVVMYKLNLMPRRLNQIAGAPAAGSSRAPAKGSSRGKTPEPTAQRTVHTGPVPGPHDEAYDRVRASLRQQRRRDRRRR
jgi:hypothetical protein